MFDVLHPILTLMTSVSQIPGKGFQASLSATLEIGMI